VPPGDRPEPADGPWADLIDAVLERWQPVRGAPTHPDAPGPTRDATALGEPPAAEAVACPLTVDAGDRAEVLIACFAAPTPPGSSARELVALAGRQYAEALEEAASLDLREEYRSYRDQIRVAEQIQRSLIPRSPDLPGLDVALVSAPSERVSGDYLDAFAIDDDRSLIVLADVTGHGLGAAIVAAQVHTMVHAHPWTRDADLPAFVQRVSRYLCRFTPDNITVTALAALHDRASGELQLVNAGHHPVLICPAAGSTAPASPTASSTGVNALLGLDYFADDPVHAERLAVTPDVWIVGYSDGVPEQRSPDGVPLGHPGAARIIVDALDAEHAAGRPPEAAAVARRVGLGLDAHQGFAPQSDDRSLFVLRGADRAEGTHPGAAR